MKRLLIKANVQKNKRTKRLEEVGSEWTDQSEPMIGFQSDAFDSQVYASSEIKRALIQSHRGCCAFCESYLRHVSYGDVEHFRPKSGVVDSGLEDLKRDAYFWLAYDPSNLLLACQVCNQVNKGNWFPVIGDRSEYDKKRIDKPVLINPYVDDPRDFIRFSPHSGFAYPYDLFHAYSQEIDGKDLTSIHEHRRSKVDQGEWTKDEKYISPYDQITRRPAFEEWLRKEKRLDLQRGIRTIGILNLNRPELIRARLDHLRQLRALYLTVQHANIKSGMHEYADVIESQRLTNLLVKGRAEDIAVQFRSLSIDALECWRSSVTSQGNNVAQTDDNTLDARPPDDDWIKHYHRLLATLPDQNALELGNGTGGGETDHPLYNDAIMFFTLQSNRVALPLQVVYLNNSDKVLGTNQGSKGVFLTIDWEEHSSWKLSVRQKGKQENEIGVLGDLLKVPVTSVHHKFRHGTLWASP